MKPILFFFLATLACTGAAAADVSCAKQMGRPLADMLAQQCRQVSPATHPPCNAANSCAMIVDELDRGCALLAGESYRPKFCAEKQRTGTFLGFLYGGGGSDAQVLTVMTDKGERIRAYCGEGMCNDLYGEPDEHEAVGLRPELVGRRVSVTIAVERNAGRIAGPSDDERIYLVRRLRLLGYSARE